MFYGDLITINNKDMAFTQPCFIRNNTPELRKELEGLGYKPFGAVKYDWDTGWGLSTDNRLGEFESFDDNGLENIIKCGPPDYEDSIDCGDNEELFLALAALRDDTDKNQHFICTKTYTDGFDITHDKGYFAKCLNDNISPRKYWHKATVEELIEHFKK